MMRLAVALAAALFPGLAGCQSREKAAEQTTSTINGLIMLIEFEGIDGLRHWERELDGRGLTALVQAQDNVLKQWPADFRRLAAKGYVISGIHAATPFWDVPYAEQHRLMKQVKETVESLTGRPMRVFGSRYFAYDASRSRKWAAARFATTAFGRAARATRISPRWSIASSRARLAT